MPLPARLVAGREKVGMNAKKLADVRHFLEEERSRLRGEIADIEREGAEGLAVVTGDQADRQQMADQGSATFSKELDMTLEDNIRGLLNSVEKAIARIDDGVYGKCVRCGKAIPGERLEAMPTAELCVPCKEWEEGR